MAGTTTIMGLPYPTSTDLVKDGATAIQSLADNLDVKTGLVLVKSQTIGTAVASVTVTDAFSAIYEAYRIVITGGTLSSSDQDVTLQLRTTTTTSTTGYYSTLVYGTYAGVGPTLFGINNGTGWTNAGGGSGTQTQYDVDLLNPYLARSTQIRSQIIRSTLAGMSVGYHNVNTSYVSFVLTPAAGTMTGGKIRVYGYNLG